MNVDWRSFMDGAKVPPLVLARASSLDAPHAMMPIAEENEKVIWQFDHK